MPLFQVIRLDLEDLGGQGVGGKGTKASNVAGGEGKGCYGAERAHSAQWRSTCRPSKSKSLERMPRIVCSVSHPSNLTKNTPFPPLPFIVFDINDESLDVRKTYIAL
jgi:hypothetical protein